MNNRIEVNIFDLFRYLIKRWIILLLFAFVFGIVANCYGYHKRVVSVAEEQSVLETYAAGQETTVEELPEYLTAELIELRKALTEEEASFVEATAKLYMYRMWASDRINGELIVGDPDEGDLEMVQTLYYANEGVQSAVQVMTSAEKSYYNVLVKRLSGTDMSKTEKTISSPGFLQPKWIVIGAVLGAFSGILLLSMFYILSGKLRAAQDMETPYGIPVLATIKTENEELKLKAVAKGIRSVLEKGGKSSLIISSVDTSRARNACETLEKALNEEKISVSYTSDNSNSFIADITDTGTVLFIEQIGKSKYSDIEAHISDCRKFLVPTIGCIVII